MKNEKSPNPSHLVVICSACVPISMSSIQIAFHCVLLPGSLLTTNCAHQILPFLVPRCIGCSTRIESCTRRIKEGAVLNSDSLIGEAEAWGERAEECSRVDAGGRSRLLQQKETKKAVGDKDGKSTGLLH